MSASWRGVNTNLVINHQIDALDDIYLPILRPIRPYKVASASEIEANSNTRTKTPKCGPYLT
jgi:hypothetical protein